MDQFLKSSKYIDFTEPSIDELAKQLSADTQKDEAIARNCFEWVRDEIRHSRDYCDPAVTLSASEVLKERCGYCYAKSHLLAALLRANKIPAAICYQRVSIDGIGAPFCLHGLNAVYLQKHGWYRIDPRGNKSGINAQFCPPQEQLAFKLSIPGEYDIPTKFSDPISSVIDVLQRFDTQEEVYHNLPDVTSEKR